MNSKKTIIQSPVFYLLCIYFIKYFKIYINIKKYQFQNRISIFLNSKIKQPTQLPTNKIKSQFQQQNYL